MAEFALTSPIQLPNGKTIDVVFVRLPNGQIVPRAPNEVRQLPTPLGRPVPPLAATNRIILPARNASRRS